MTMMIMTNRTNICFATPLRLHYNLIKMYFFFNYSLFIVTSFAATLIDVNEVPGDAHYPVENSLKKVATFSLFSLGQLVVIGALVVQTH